MKHTCGFEASLMGMIGGREAQYYCSHCEITFRKSVTAGWKVKERSEKWGHPTWLTKDTDEGEYIIRVVPTGAPRGRPRRAWGLLCHYFRVLLFDPKGKRLYAVNGAARSYLSSILTDMKRRVG